MRFWFSVKQGGYGLLCSLSGRPAWLGDEGVLWACNHSISVVCVRELVHGVGGAVRGGAEVVWARGGVGSGHSGTADLSTPARISLKVEEPLE